MKKILSTIEEEPSSIRSSHLVDTRVRFKVVVIQDYEASKDDPKYGEDKDLVFFDIKKGQIYGITDIIEGGWLHGYLIKDTSHSVRNPFDSKKLGYLPNNSEYVIIVPTKKNKSLKAKSKKRKLNKKTNKRKTKRINSKKRKSKRINSKKRK